MDQFSSILQIPVQSENPDDWSIKMEVSLVLFNSLSSYPICVCVFSVQTQTDVYISYVVT